ncbi:MAG: protein translocase subunit SecD [Gammaproteobacteria bacterium]|nr:protein translocase subunit SecD [Gammaproteobacteria bacterium]MDH3469236.1 protein translocase subunit SecD [Gammaproteobacteria bacterium]
MINKYPWWKYAVIAVVLAVGALYALPNVFDNDPGIQIRGARGLRIDTAAFENIQGILQKNEAAPSSAVLDAQGAKLRFADVETQLQARDILERELGENYTTALSLLPATPRWLQMLDAAPMYLGLDLRGGVHFLMEVDLESAIRRTEESQIGDLRRRLREEKIRYVSVSRRDNGGVSVKFRDDENRRRAEDLIEREIEGITVQDVEQDGSPFLLVDLTEPARIGIAEAALTQNMTALRNRIDELGVAEPVVQRQGHRRIVVQLPGVQDTAEAKRILGRTATLEIMLVDEDNNLAAVAGGPVPGGSKLFTSRNRGQILLENRVIYSGQNMVNAAASLDTQSGGPIVTITLDSDGASRNQRVTGDNIGNRMAVVYVEVRSEVRRDADGRALLDADGNIVRDTRRIEEVITAPVIRDQLSARFQIEGLDSVDEARDLALLLRAGALAAPVVIVEERTVGPMLGQQNIDQGKNSVIIGFILVLIFMAFYYRVFGLVANLALAVNLVLIVAILSILQATLTLPGVAGIVLTVGMAVDANVLIFERIREELQNGNSPQASIHVGYDRALSTIVDANITTLIAAVVLFNFGTGPIKGFAITLSIGILSSMFTAIMGTRGVINLIYGGKRIEKLAI